MPNTTMKIANIVATVSLTSTLDLSYIHSRLPQTEFPGKSPWLKMRLPPDNTYIAFYKSGKFLITTKNAENIPHIAGRIVSILNDIDIREKIQDITIHNIVVVDTIPLNTTLETLIATLDPGKSEYEPEQFPALVYKDWGVSFLIFSTGKVVVTGLKDFKDAELVITNLKNVINTK